jgi:chemotaxis protein CheD
VTRPRSLRAGELRVLPAPGKLVIHGLGSCVAVFVYDAGPRVGGMAHILLPGPPGKETGNLGRYATTAVAAIVEESIRLGARREALRAKVAGGSRMFVIDSGAPRPTVGDKNIQAALQALQDARVEVVAHDVGGEQGRTVVADLSDGSLTITTVRGEPRVV